jgi:sRNA-binding protein
MPDPLYTEDNLPAFGLQRLYSRRIRGSKRSHRIRLKLLQRFPAAFRPFGALKVPLKLGILDDIVLRCPDLREKGIAEALGDYCGGASYITALILPGAHRIDLDGSVIESVSEIHADRARVAMLHNIKSRDREKWTALVGLDSVTLRRATA